MKGRPRLHRASIHSEKTNSRVLKARGCNTESPGKAVRPFYESARRSQRLIVDGTIPAAFKVTESTVSPNGIIIVNYERAGAIRTGSY